MWTESDPPPTCPNCDGEMSRKVSSRSGKPFWGCRRWPECDGIVEIEGNHKTPDDQRQEQKIGSEFRCHAALEFFKLQLSDPKIRESLWHRYMIDKPMATLAVELADDLIRELNK